MNMKDLLVLWKPTPLAGGQVSGSTTDQSDSLVAEAVLPTAPVVPSGKSASFASRAVIEDLKPVILPALSTDSTSEITAAPASDGADTASIESHPAESDQDSLLHPALLRRFGDELLASADPLALRHACVLQRLCIVRDTCEVVIAGRGRSVRINMANGRIMAATFDLPGRRTRLVSFHKVPTRTRLSREFAVLLAELCATSDDLLITENPVSGVFDGAAGMVVGDLVLEASIGLPDAENGAKDKSATAAA